MSKSRINVHRSAYMDVASKLLVTHKYKDRLIRLTRVQRGETVYLTENGQFTTIMWDAKTFELHLEAVRFGIGRGFYVIAPSLMA